MIGLVVKQLQFGWVLAEDLQLGKNRKGSVVHTVNYSSTFNQSNIVSTGGTILQKGPEQKQELVRGVCQCESAYHNLVGCSIKSQFEWEKTSALKYAT